MRECPLLAFVVPCYNEEETLPHTVEALSSLLEDLKRDGRIAGESFALYVDEQSHFTQCQTHLHGCFADSGRLFGVRAHASRFPY